MHDFPVSRKFIYEMDELYTKRRTKEITEEDFSIQRDALLAQETKSHDTLGPILITKQLEAIEADVANTVNQKFQKEEQEANDRIASERIAKIAERNRIEREEKAKQNAIEAEHRKRVEDRHRFRSSVDLYISHLEDETNNWQRRFNWLQIILIIITTATASMAGFNDIPRAYVVIVGFAAASLGGILSFFQLQDKIYSSRKALADLRLECQMYDHCNGDYKNRHEEPEKVYLTFSKKVTAIQARQMLHEVELLNPKKKEAIVEPKEQPKKEEQSEQENQEDIDQEHPQQDKGK